MQQMVSLMAMGYQVSGPVNGPNEGLPKFEVPEEWLNSLPTEQPLILTKIRTQALSPTVSNSAK
jgi:hypothetical protein